MTKIFIALQKQACRKYVSDFGKIKGFGVKLLIVYYRPDVYGPLQKSL